MSETHHAEIYLDSAFVVTDVFDTEVSFDPLISDEAIVIIKWLLDAVVCQMIDIFGIGTNIVNVICFIKQGFKDSVNVSLFGLAIADLCCLVTLMWTNIFLTPAFSSADLPFDPIEFMYLTIAWTHNTFSRISGWITALIILERCICITAPLKVKDIVTPKRASVVIICVFIIITASVAPLYVVNRLDLKFFPDRNKTLIGLVYTEHRDSVEKFSYAINNVLIPLSGFMIIIICTSVLVIKLRKTTKWREQFTKSAQSDIVSIRNQKVAIMVVMISALFITCFIPLSILFIAMSLLPELSIVGKHQNMLLTVAGLGVIMESINSSSNIFIYYHMSSNYRAAFYQLFSGEHKRLPKKWS